MLQPVIDNYKNRLAQFQQAIQQSAAQYTQKENELKAHLNNHNAMIGAANELQNVVTELEKTQKEPEEKNENVLASPVKAVESKENTAVSPGAPVPTKI